ncbi:MAG: coproporphyrinogen III oxidase, partial [Rhodobacter sp.]|nr:coproporphyrinogen III oxidase [Rhodobacter sp.]
MPDVFDDRKARAASWFRQLRDRIIAAFEGLEDTQLSGPTAHLSVGRFEVSETARADGG